MIFDTTPLTFRAVAFTFVNAARVLLTPVDGKFRSSSLTLVNDTLTVVNWTDP